MSSTIHSDANDDGAQIENSNSRNWWKWITCFLLLIAFAVAFRLSVQAGGRSYNPDEAQYAAAVAYYTESSESWGETIGAGPDRPVHMAVYTLCDILFGHYPTLALNIAYAAIIGATASLLSLISAQLLGLAWRAGALVGVVFVLHSYFFYEGWTNNTEHVVNLLKVAFVAIWLLGHRLDSALLRSMSFLLLGLAVLTKMQQIPMVLCAPVFWYLTAREPRRFRDFVLEMLWSGAFFLLPFLLISQIMGQPLGGASDFEISYFFSRMFGYSELLRHFTAGFLYGPIGLPAVVIAGAALAYGLATWSFPPKRSGELAPLYLASSLFALESLSTVPGLRFHEHYFLMIVPGGILVLASGASLVLRKTGIKFHALAAALLAVVCLQVSQLPRMGHEDPLRAEALGWIAEHSAPGDRIYVWGWDPKLYAGSDRVPATRFVITAYVVNDTQVPNDLPAYNRENLDLLLDDLETHTPSLLVVVRRPLYTLAPDRYEIENVPAFRNYVEKNFESTPVAENGRYRILKRRKL